MIEDSGKKEIPTNQSERQRGSQRGNSESISAAITQVLEDMTRADIVWAFLQDPAGNLEEMSDYDLAANASGPVVLDKLREQWERVGLRPIVHSHYDIGRGDAIWIWSDSHETIIHLDLLSDPTGMGRLGIPTEPVLRTISNGGPLPVAAESWRQAYALSKGLNKRRPIDSAIQVLTRPSEASSIVFGAKSVPDPIVAVMIHRQWLAAKYLRARILRGRLARNRLGLLPSYAKRVISRLRRRAGRVVVFLGSHSSPFQLELARVLRTSFEVRTMTVSGRGWIAALRAWALTVRPKIVVAECTLQRFPLFSPDVVIDVGTRESNADQTLAHVMRLLADVTYDRIG